MLLSGLATGGAERVTVSFLERLAARRVPVTACTLTDRHDGPLAAELARSGVRRVDLGARRLADPRALWRLRALLLAEPIDLVHAHGQDASILAAAVRRLHPARLVVSRHVLEEPNGSARERLRARAALRAFRRADATVAVSHAAAERLSSLAHLPREHVHVIPNGIDVDAYASPARGAARAEVLAELRLPDDAFLVLLPAVLRDGKGHEVLLAALPAILERAPRVRVLFAGGGPREEELRERASPLGRTVRVLGARTDMPRLLAACDLVALPSWGEALPTALMEAAAAGRPVVATRVGGVPEVVDHGRTGLLVPAGDAAALAAAVVSLLNEPCRAASMGRAAAERARADFGLDRQVQRTLELWQRLLGQEGRRVA